ncbi:MAG: rRNA maturation RNase YbeY [Acidobacteriaceae bacterium]
MITLEPPRSTPAHSDAWSAWGLSRASLSRFATKAQVLVGLKGDVEILLASDATLRRLNRSFRQKDKPTDVLSFPISRESVANHAGDLAISLQTAQRQAVEHGHTLSDEVRILLLHGLLHLAGMDHETDSGEMASRESALRQQLKLPLGLIDRTARKPMTTKPKLSRSKVPLKPSKAHLKPPTKTLRQGVA